jgi:predicted O-methyltransferase YrrM
MNLVYRSADYDTYRMDYNQPFVELEPLASEEAVVDGALQQCMKAGILPHTHYDRAQFAIFRRTIQEKFEIPWTAITPRMQRLIWAINAIIQPQNMIAAGVFCGNTFISNAGAGVGPGAVYTARNLIGVEIKEEEAERAERNVRRIDPTGVARVVAADAVDTVAQFKEPINLLYLDADGAGGRGKGVYLDILEAGLDRLPAGSVILAHNSVNCAEKLSYYLDYVRDPVNCKASINMIFDIEGLEVSVR